MFNSLEGLFSQMEDFSISKRANLLENCSETSQYFCIVYVWHGAEEPAQLLYETGGTFADGFGKVDLLDTPDGCTETL